MTGKIKRACAALALAGLCLLAGCKSAGGGLAGGGAVSRPAQVESAELQFTRPAPGDTVAIFDTSAGVFRAVLFPDEAPQTCETFIGLAQAGYYDGLTITRAEAGVVDQDVDLVAEGQAGGHRGGNLFRLGDVEGQLLDLAVVVPVEVGQVA